MPDPRVSQSCRPCSSSLAHPLKTPARCVPHGLRWPRSVDGKTLTEADNMCQPMLFPLSAFRSQRAADTPQAALLDGQGTLWRRGSAIDFTQQSHLLSSNASCARTASRLFPTARLMLESDTLFPIYFHIRTSKNTHHACSRPGRQMQVCS